MSASLRTLRSRRGRWLGVALLGAVGLLGAISSCTSTVPRRDPTGERFPTVTGDALDGTRVTLPDDLSGPATVLLVGYVQETQFDLDRWILGLAQAGTPARVLEVPTIPGLVPGMVSGSIDGGMRSGIPSEDWGLVVTLYGDDAGRVRDATGNETPRNGRVLLVDGEGRVRWFHDRGYSAGTLLELDAAVRTLVAGEEPAGAAPDGSGEAGPASDSGDA